MARLRRRRSTKVPLRVERGHRGHNVGFGFGPGNNEVFNPSPISLGNLEKMVKIDGQARALYNLMRLPIIRNAVPHIIPVAGGREKGRFVEEAFTRNANEGGMEIPFRDVIAQQTTAFLFGFSAHEVQYKFCGSECGPILAGGHTIRKLAPRKATQMSFKVNRQNGEYDGAIQRVWRGTSNTTIEYKKNELYPFVVNKEFNNLYGQPDFEPVFYHYDKKHRLYYLTHLAVSVRAVAPRFIKGSPTTHEDEKAKILKDVSDFGVNAAIWLDPDIDVEFPDGVNQGSDDLFMEIIEHHNNEMAKALLAQWSNLGFGRNSGATGGAEIGHDMYLMMLEARQREMAQWWQELVIPPLVDFNFSTPGQYPAIEFDPLTTEHRDLIKEVFTKLAVSREPHASVEFLQQMELNLAGEMNLDTETIKSQHSLDNRIRDKIDQEVRQIIGNPRLVQEGNEVELLRAVQGAADEVNGMISDMRAAA